MKKIMFDNRFGLTKAVLDCRKTTTRRFITEKIRKKAEAYRQEYYEGTLDAISEEYALLEFSPFKPGEVVAVAQSYKDAGLSFIPCPDPQWGCTRDMPGYNNKMFVRADLMPHQLRITSVRIERIQDISDEDCLKEGIIEFAPFCECGSELYAFDGADDFWYTPREAFAALIKKMYGGKAWEKNSQVFVYDFKLVK